jgi:hypothetical protein
VQGRGPAGLQSLLDADAYAEVAVKVLHTVDSKAGPALAVATCCQWLTVARLLYSCQLG